MPLSSTQARPILDGILRATPGIMVGDYRLDALVPGVDAVKGFFPSGFLAIQTRRQGGVSEGSFASLNLGDHVGDDPQRVLENRARLRRCLPAEPLWLQQVHGCDVAEAGSAATAKGSCPPKADASFTADPRQVCAIMTADCLPLLVARPATGQCAAIHAGWRGLLNGVIEAALNRLVQSTAAPEAVLGGEADLGRRQALAVSSTARDDIYLWLGPAIGEDAFEVGEEVRVAFLARMQKAILGFAAAKNGDGKWRASLAGLAIQRIAAWSDAAKKPEMCVHVAVSPDCTYRDSQNHFSYRRDGVTGRMVSAICRI